MLPNPTVKTIFYDEEGNPSECSGVYFGHTYILTAAHCINEFIISGKVLTAGMEQSAISIAPNPKFKFDGKVFHGDVAVLTLAKSFDLASPHFDSTVVPTVGERIHLYGYQLSAKNNRNDHSVHLRGGTMIISSVDDEFIRARFDGSGHNSCVGDSGGPVFLERDGALWLVGLVSSGTRLDCGAGDTSIFTRLNNQSNLDFWQKQIESAPISRDSQMHH